MSPITWIAAGLAVLLIAGVFLWILYAFYRTQVRAVRKCRESARTIKPGLIYLGIIPIFGYFFMFWSIWKIAESLRKEFEIRDIADFMTRRVNLARNIGYVFLLSPLLILLPFITAKSPIPDIIMLIFWIIYWAKISSVSAVLDKNEFLPDPVGATVPGVQDGSGI
jgi:hypothetical protein